MSLRCSIGNSLWRLTCRRDDLNFSRSIEDCRSAQEVLLLDLLCRNRNCRFGRDHGFDAIRSVEDFRRTVPISNFEDYEPAIENIAEGQKRVLTVGDVELFEPTSGSTSPCKLIPYTRDLRDQFRRAIAPWVMSLYRQFPGFHDGPAYWSLSPPARRLKRHGAVPVGFDHDWQYLGAIGRVVYSQIAVRPAGMDCAVDTTAFRRNTLVAMLKAKDLRFISIWSPSFLTLLLEWYLDNAEEVLDALVNDASRKAELRSIGVGPDVFERIWPELRVISCWTDAAGAGEANYLKSFFPNVPFQGKGLVATEAVVSIPYSADNDPVLASNAHFFEFLDGAGDIRLAHELTRGETYTVIVTTGGGLYRYCLHDRVEATGFLGTTPCLRFLGKDDLISDLRGEKLHGTHAATCIESTVKPAEAQFAMLAPNRQGKNDVGYTLFVQLAGRAPAGMATRLEASLRANPHYRLCAELGQLLPARVFSISKNAAQVYEERCIGHGLKRGDVKPTALSTMDGWAALFDGAYLSEGEGGAP